ncbi:hypothetical protein [Natrialba aegyptia]|uniref:Uncharacterized protein n=1 Tax=Natrialba aegyptia DSM 13077 TaxID=1227491 RepID=M0B6P2_9EURY|nr:hypothetical protein [Natrialba aegyptia]ELZ05319.1 hypothetical protein C480_10565 [Natrialba aegyptia DSM 13077]
MSDDLSFAERRLKMTREALRGAIAVDAPAGVIEELENKRDEWCEKVMNEQRPEPRDDRRVRRKERQAEHERNRQFQKQVM